MIEQNLHQIVCNACYDISYLSFIMSVFLIIPTIIPLLFILPFLQPEWIMFMGQEAEDALTALGSKWAARVGQGEVWAWVGVVGGVTLGEAVTTREMKQYPASDLRLDVYVAKTKEAGR